jgi:hypothetical protein
MSRSPSARAPLALLVVLGLAACDDGPAPPPLPPEPAPSQEPATIAPVPATTGDPSAAPSSAAADAGAGADADGGVPIEALAGKWEGAYDAKKGRISMPSGVRDDARTAEDGKQSSGPGLVQIEIATSGDVTGKSQGALGAAGIRGKMDGKMLRASFVPDDPLSPRAMTGVLIGLVKGDVIQAELRVAGPDALVVRQANFDLKKK